MKDPGKKSMSPNPKGKGEMGVLTLSLSLSSLVALEACSERCDLTI
jgi:hypothetical protein